MKLLLGRPIIRGYVSIPECNGEWSFCIDSWNFRIVLSVFARASALWVSPANTRVFCFQVVNHFDLINWVPNINIKLPNQAAKPISIHPHPHQKNAGLLWWIEIYWLGGVGWMDWNAELCHFAFHFCRSFFTQHTLCSCREFFGFTKLQTTVESPRHLLIQDFEVRGWL